MWSSPKYPSNKHTTSSMLIYCSYVLNILFVSGVAAEVEILYHSVILLALVISKVSALSGNLFFCCCRSSWPCQPTHSLYFLKHVLEQRWNWCYKSLNVTHWHRRLPLLSCNLLLPHECLAVYRGLILCKWLFHFKLFWF